MKNKKLLVLVPASLMLLNACGNADVSIPKDYAPIDMNDAAARKNYAEKFVDDYEITAQKAANDGYKVKGSFSIDELSINYSKKYDKSYASFYSDEGFEIKLTDLSFDFLIEEAKNDKGTRSAMKIEDFGFKLSATYGGKNYNLRAKDIDVACYIDSNNFYIDLSDRDLKTFLKDTVNVLYADADEKTKSDLIATYEIFLDKFYIKNFSSSILDVAEDLVPTTISAGTSTTTKMSDSARKELISFVESAIEKVNETNAKDYVTFSEQKNGKGIAVGFAVANEEGVYLTGKKDSDEYASLKGNLGAALVFDKNGVFERFGVNGNGTLVSHDYEKDYRTVNVQIKLDDLDFGFEYSAGNRKVSIPKLDDFKELPSNALDLFKDF